MPLEGTAVGGGATAEAVWELARSGHQPSGSFGEILDVLVSSRPEGSSYTNARAVYLDRLALLATGGAGELTPARAALLDRLDALISSRAAAADYTAARAAKLDYLDALISSRLASVDYTPGASVADIWAYATRLLSNLSDVRAAKIDNLDALISSRPAGSDYTAARAALLDKLDAPISSRAAITDYTAVRAGYLDRLDAAITSRPAGSDYSAARAAKLDYLDALISSRPAGSDYTQARAVKLDYLDAYVSGAGGGMNVLVDSGYPSITVTSTTTADTFGAWAQLYANVGTSKRLYFVVLSTIVGAIIEFEIEVGEGAAGSEAAITRFSHRLPWLSAVGAYPMLIFPLYRALTNNARLSARVRTDGTTARILKISALKG